MDFAQVNRESNKEILGVNTVADGAPIPYLIAFVFVLISGIIFIFTISLMFGFMYMVAVPSALVLIFGRNPAKQLERMTQPKRYANQDCSLFYDNVGMPQTPTPERMGQLASIQENFPLKTYGQVNIAGQEIGYRLFQWGENNVKAEFDVEVEGNDSTLPGDEAQGHLEGTNTGLCSLGAELKSIWDVRSSCEEPLAQIAQQIQQAKDPLTIAQLSAEAERLVALKASGKLAKSRIIYQIKCRLELHETESPPESPADVLLDYLDKFVPQFLKEEKRNSKATWERAIKYAYGRMYKETFETITSPNGFGLTARPLTAQEMCDWDYGETHNDGLEVPQCQILDHYGLGELIVNDPANHALYALFEPREGLPAVPLFKDDCAYLPIKNQWVGAIRFADLRMMPKVDGSVEKGFLEFFYRKLCTGNSPITDFRLVTELLPDTPYWSRYLLEQTYRNSVRREDRAAMKKDVDVVARERKRAADQNLEWLNQGNQIMNVALCLFLYRSSEEELKKDLRTVSRRFSSTSCEIIQHRFNYVYFAQMALSSAPLLTFPTSAYSGPRHYLYRTSSLKATTTIPQIQPPKMDDLGVMLIGQELPISYFWDIVWTNPNHTLVTGQTGCGKSMFMIRAIQAYIVAQQAGVIFDFPPPNGQSTYEPLVATLNRLGVSATYQSVDKKTINIMGIPDISWVDELPAPGEPGYYPEQPTRESTISYIAENKLRILQAIAGLNKQTGLEVELMSRALSLCFAEFYQENKDRYEVAAKAPFGSEDAAQMPIYSEFVSYAYGWLIRYAIDNDVQTHIREQFDALYLLLKGVMSTSLGRAINGISAFDTNVDILVLGLTNVDTSQDSLIYGLSGFDLLLRKAMSQKKTLLMMDEGSELFVHSVFANMFGSICAAGRKWGCNVVLGFTGLESLVASPAASNVIANLQNRFVSKINKNSYKILVDHFDFRPENLKCFKKSAYNSNKQLQESYFIWKRDDRELLVKYAPDNVTLAVGANSKLETEARNRVMAQHTDPVAGLVAFGNQLSEANAKGLEPTHIGVNPHAA
ncbi:hypothetical protein [Acaryochloris sp. CCMEE 5410]|uniref:hypothetical protein n=1 Tax=Acaryochloris sp. CCMEE 5410 TaxID=310037 RepID=UPI000248506F|nr:hypothetical protein [Acaryochloris sp. CCMEE 5410]KAI9129456.1 hypothetical protein ON05_035720 [Acaryochloris sp. CCMEE 5410]